MVNIKIGVSISRASSSEAFEASKDSDKPPS